MKYFFILGSNPSLSVAEIQALFPKAPGTLLAPAVFVLDTKEIIDAKKIINRMGGIIKIGEIKEIFEKKNNSELLAKFLSIVTSSSKLTNGGKFNFGFSNYGKEKINTRALGLEIKKYLKEKSISSRLVESRDKTLSSVVVEQNKLIDKGIEAIICSFENNYYLGKTLAVQNFKALSFRDYNRPGRDDQSGMLPPKLAQIMINLSQASLDKKILDPFCGSGTIITEAMLMGYTNIFGSDLSERAVSDTKKNIPWIKNFFPVENINPEIFLISATEVSKKIPTNYIDAIITEPYLGPQRGNRKFDEIRKELEKLYSTSLREFKKILRKDGKVVMIWPTFQTNRGFITLNPNYQGYKIIKPIDNNSIKNSYLVKTTERHTIVYGREDQKVWREIVILKRDE